MDRFFNKEITIEALQQGFAAVKMYNKKEISLNVLASIINSVDKTSPRYLPCQSCSALVRKRINDFVIYMFKHLIPLFPDFVPKLPELSGKYFSEPIKEYLISTSFEAYNNKVSQINGEQVKYKNDAYVSQSDVEKIRNYGVARYNIDDFIKNRLELTQLVKEKGLTFEFSELKSLFKQQLADGYTIDDQIKFWNTTKSFVSKHRKIISEENE